MPETIKLEIARYSPERDEKPRFQIYEVPLRKDWVVLDGLNHIKDKLDGSLSYRWSCRMGICGSCGMMVDGEPKLTCATFLSSYARKNKPVRVEPLRYFPVIRDLVTAIDGFMDKLKKVKPWLVRKPDDAAGNGEYLQTPEQLDAYRHFSMCINCLLCYAACPVVGLDQDFVGPAAIALAQRYNRDSRDQGADERLDVLLHPEGIWGCTFVGECSKVCPKHVDPAGAIQQYKLTAAMQWARSFILPWGAREK
jgi:fumarate reductase iron-sulfur subunit